MEDERIVKDLVKKGRVLFGRKQTLQSIREGKSKLIVLASNCPFKEEIKTVAREKQVPVYEGEANSIKLGYTCGKQFAISTLSVIDDGGVKIDQLVKG